MREIYIVGVYLGRLGLISEQEELRQRLTKE